MEQKKFQINKKLLLLVALNCAISVHVDSAAAAESSLLLGKDKNALREQAVMDARNGNYKQSLEILKELYDGGNGDLASIYDYITILHWAGQNNKAIEIYERNKLSDSPDYVISNMASAYYRLAEYEKALELIGPLVAKGDKKALILKGQIYASQNNTYLAEETFNILLEKETPEKILRLKAEMAVNLHNWQWAAAMWRTALLEKEQGRYAKISRNEIVDNLSVAYLRIGRIDDAIILLDPYIQNHTATANMVGNYIGALVRKKHYTKAIDVYKSFFEDRDNIPVFVLREIAECFYLVDDYKKAAMIYKYIYKEGYAGKDDLFRLGYIGCHTKKYREAGIDAYAKLLEQYKSSSTITRILVDARELLSRGRLTEAASIYNMLIAEDKRFRNLYVQDLIDEEQYQTAWNIACKKNESGVISFSDIESLVKMSVIMRDYQEAKDYAALLSECYDEEYPYSMSAGALKNRLQGELYAYADSYSDHDDGDSYGFGLYATQHLGDSWWGEYETGKSYLRENGRNATIDINSVGLRYSKRKFDTLIGVNGYKISGSDNFGARIDSLFRPDDRQNLHFTYNYGPVTDIDAIEYSRGAIFADRFSFRYTYNLNQHESAYAELNYNSYDFDNEEKGWRIGHSLQIYNSNGRTLRRELHWGRSRFSNQDVPYTSPKLQESVGIEWDWGRDLMHDDTLHHILGINWERDYPDALALDPFYRIEYQHSFSKHQFLTIGCGYGLETKSWLGGGSWSYNNKHFDITYNLTW